MPGPVFSCTCGTWQHCCFASHTDCLEDQGAFRPCPPLFSGAMAQFLHNSYLASAAKAGEKCNL